MHLHLIQEYLLFYDYETTLECFRADHHAVCFFIFIIHKYIQFEDLKRHNQKKNPLTFPLNILFYFDFDIVFLYKEIDISILSHVFTCSKKLCNPKRITDNENRSYQHQLMLDCFDNADNEAFTALWDSALPRHATRQDRFALRLVLFL